MTKHDGHLKVIELFSGIGGMRYALQASGIPHSVEAAVDINNIVNEIYRHNFGPGNHIQRNIMSFTAAEIDSFKADLITLSPPCQPFTRVGLKLDSADSRSQVLLHFLQIFPNLKYKPAYLLLENVLGFENSEVRSKLLATLRDCCYSYQEFLMSPVQFGIPNSRTRYYLIAKQNTFSFAFMPTGNVETEWPKITTFASFKFFCKTCRSENLQQCILSHFLENKPESYFENFLVPNKVLLKNIFVHDIVEESSTSSCCFTKGYSHYAKGTGSVLHPSSAREVSGIFDSITGGTTSNQRLEMLKTLKLRYFTPQEIANLMCFPNNFSFPDHTSVKQRNKALGNSVNVFVVSCLLLLLLQNG